METTPGTHYIWGWVGPRTGLDVMDKTIILPLPGIEPRLFGRPAPQSLVDRLNELGISGFLDFLHRRQNPLESRLNGLFKFFFLVSWGGVRLSPLGTSATNWPIVPAPDDRWWVWSSRWNENWQGKPKYSEKTWMAVYIYNTSTHTLFRLNFVLGRTNKDIKETNVPFFEPDFVKASRS
jgi:hypothetical protein